MIVHLAPRRVSLISTADGQQNGIPIDLNTILAVDIQAGPTERLDLIVRLTNGECVIACTYAQMAEAGPDRRRLRVLAGLPVSGDSGEASASASSWLGRPQIVATATIVLVAALIAFLLAIMELHDKG